MTRINRGRDSSNSRQVSTYLDSRLFEKLEKYRDGQGINRSDAAEELIALGLSCFEAPKERTFFETQFDPPKPKPVLPSIPEIDKLAEKVLIDMGQMASVAGMAPYHLIRSALALYAMELKKLVVAHNTPLEIAKRELQSQSE